MSELILLLLISGFVGAAAGYLSSLMLSKRMSLVGGPLGHLAIPGVGLALIYGFDISVGAGLFILLGSVLIWFISLRTDLSLEAITAIVFASSTAVFFIFVPQEHTLPALIGDLSQLNPIVVIITVLLSSVILLVTRRIFSKLVLMTISEDLAQAEGVDVKKYNLIYLTCIGLTIALGVRIVGGLMTAALVAIPAATSRNFTHSMKSYSLLSLIVGAVSCLVGVYASTITSLSAGPLIVAVNSLFFLTSLIFKKN